jgi:hypothetical protein
VTGRCTSFVGPSPTAQVGGACQENNRLGCIRWGGIRWWIGSRSTVMTLLLALLPPPLLSHLLQMSLPLPPMPPLK